ncbi:heavy metal translocatin [Hypoxylon fragiforme]|uniref:heavy metal translocatin n=1 Tax=Hypoxylon fragiforme TaxID=63214 RepID=UPI0020C72454|nr:heavy metal translocatin [Hypoxylon fragiforme]KAI2609408.1 heavy metal translocatin [Hypoxylon fragiforme]
MDNLNEKGGEKKEKGKCSSPCCAAPKPTPPKEEKKGCKSGCCGGNTPSKAPEKDDCCKPSASKDEEKLASVGPLVEVADQRCQPAPVPAKPIETSGCNAGCCAPKPQDKDSCCGTAGSNGGPEVADGCCAAKDQQQEGKDSCCSPGKKVVVDDDYESCQDACCDSKEPVDDDGCCGPAKELPKDACKDKCCSASKSDAIEPSCCEGKQKPCCDATCIDRLVLRETTANAKQDDDDDASSSSGKGSLHSREKSIRKRYETRLAAIGCLCRALIALGQESCCVSPELSSEERKRGPRKSRPASRGKQTSNCCAKKAGGCCTKAPEPERKIAASGLGGTKKACSKGCCGKPKEVADITPAKETGCCSGGSSSKEDCCLEEKITPVERGLSKDALGAINLEKGLSGSERVALSISGMTCTGCETKLQQTLGKVAAVKHLKTSLVMARVEFQLDLSLATPEDVKKHIERTTEFKCDIMVTHGSTLDVIPVGGAKQFAQESLPLGVENVDVLDDKTARITFDPEVIGARDLIYNGFGTPPILAPLQADPALAAGSKHVRHMGWMTLLSAVLTIPVLVLAWAPLEDRPITYGSVSLALATIVQVVIAGPFYPKALKSLVFSRVVEMDLLIVLSTTAAYTFSVVSFGYLVGGHPLSTGEFFETCTLLVTLIMVGRWVSALARQKAVESISIRTLQASTAILLSQDGSEVEIDTRLLQYGDLFKVAPHTQAPTDGVILSGTTEVDESMLTGESRPVDKNPGSTIVAGTLNGSGAVTVRLTKLPGENTISTIAGMVDDAKLSKPKIQDLADRVASYFVPVVISLTIIVFVIWTAVGISLQNLSGGEAVTQAVTYGITVLIVSCPCAIGLAVPMVIVIACGVAAEKGVIFKASEALEVAHKTSHVVFDKTGTLTEGKLSVTTEEYPSDTGRAVAPLILGLLANVNHPVSSSVSAHLRNQDIAAAQIDQVRSLPGKGVQGYVNGVLMQAGNSHWLSASPHPAVQAVLARGHTAFCVTIGAELQAVFGLTDTLRPSALSTVAELQRRRIAVSLLSGDDAAPVQAVASALSIPAQNVRSRCSPADKRQYIQSLLLATPPQSKPPVIIFLGDGTNDAVALAQATIGVHLSSSSSTSTVQNVAQSAADVVLMRPSLSALLSALDVSRAAARRVYFNFAWSAVYNVFAVLLAAGAFVSTGGSGRGGGGVRIPPEFAGVGELVSVLPVVVVAVSLRWVRGL